MHTEDNKQQPTPWKVNCCLSGQINYDVALPLGRGEISPYKNLLYISIFFYLPISKGSVGRSFGYDNRFESDLLFKARSNDLDLNVFKRHTGGAIVCDLCGAVREDLEHFLFNCQKLEGVRDRTLIDRIAKTGDSVDRIGNLLFCKTYVEEIKMQLGRLWRERNTPYYG